ncbi:MAG: hypothetical protein HYT68_01705 [Candidatus Zambryskibacteria bacterium]|nr:hypothetical protein [Candidatus Zambryskibacteria bacterium]
MDDTKIAETIFDSTSDSLEKVSAEWVATNGKHFVQAKIDAKLPENKELLSYETDRAVLEISRVLTLEEVKEETEQILSAIVEKADEAAESFASRLESFKKPISSEIKASESNGSSLPEMEAAPASINNGVVASAYNAGIDLISFLLKEWKWTLASLAVFAIIFSFR